MKKVLFIILLVHLTVQVFADFEYMPVGQPKDEDDEEPQGSFMYELGKQVVDAAGNLYNDIKMVVKGDEAEGWKAVCREDPDLLGCAEKNQELGNCITECSYPGCDPGLGSPC